MDGYDDGHSCEPLWAGTIDERLKYEPVSVVPNREWRNVDLYPTLLLDYSSLLMEFKDEL